MRASAIAYGLTGYILGFVGGFVTLPWLLLGSPPSLDSLIASFMALFIPLGHPIYFLSLGLLLAGLLMVEDRKAASALGLAIGCFNAFILLSWLLSVYP